MPRSHYRPTTLIATFAAVTLVLSGCGTTRSTDTARTATEQLLISDAIDRSVQTIDFEPLSGQTVYLDSSMLKGVTDRNYLVSTLRQHLLASGCTLKETREDADFVVEARAGAVGTDRNDLLFGIPATNVPQILPLQGMPAAIPEVPLAKRRDQRGIAKISMFAYHRESGLPVWQSGLAVRESSSNDVWVFGAGPFEHGTLHNRKVLDERMRQKAQIASATKGTKPRIDLTKAATFDSPAKIAQRFRRLPEPNAVAVAATPPASILPALPVMPPAMPTIERNAPPVAPNLVQAAAPADDLPRLTGHIYDTQQILQEHTKTVRRAPQESPDSDVIPLPTPRFDSL